MQLGPVLFTNPWGLLAFLSLPAILGLHFFRRTFQERTVSGLFLWQNVMRSESGGTRFDRPPVSWSLLLQLLIATLLSLLICQPRLSVERQHNLLLLDVSASMRAQPENGEASFERARRRARDLLASMDSTARVTLMKTGHPTERVGEPGMSPSKANALLEEMEPGYQSFEPEKAIQRAYHLAGKRSRIYFVTDQSPSSYDGMYPPRFQWISVGRPTENVAWTTARRKPERDGGSRLFVQLKNYSGRSQSVRIQLFAEGTRFKEFRTSVPPEGGWKSTVSVSVPDTPVRVSLTAERDALSLDDELLLRPVKPLTIRTRVQLDDQSKRSRMKNTFSSLSGVQLVTEETAPVDLLVGPSDPEELPPASVVYFGVGPLSSDPEETSYVQGPYLVARTHPLMKHVHLEGVVFGGVHTERSPSLGQPIVSAGDVPLIYTDSRGAEHHVLTNFDPENSTLLNRVAWPIMMTNLVDLTRKQLPGPERVNVRMDEPIVLKTFPRFAGQNADRGTWTLENPDGTRRSLEPGQRVRIDSPRQPGTYRLQRTDESGDVDRTWPVQVNFLHPKESDLRSLGPGTDGSKMETEATRAEWMRQRPVEMGIIFLLLGLCVLCWLRVNRSGPGSHES